MIGLTLQTVTPVIADGLGLPEGSGLIAADVMSDSPAAAAGLKAGDILVEFDGVKIDNLYDFTYALRQKRVGDVVEVEVLRDDKPLRAKVQLAERK